jgi:O-antigen ligase
MLAPVLYLQLLHVVNQLHFKWLVTGIPGVAPANLFFLLGLLCMQGKQETLTTEPFLKNALLIFYGALTLAFVWALVRQPGDPVDDFTYFKNALFGPLYYFTFLKCRQDEKTTRRLIIWILIIAAVAALQALRQGFDYGFGKYNPFNRASGPFGEDWQQSNRAGVFYGMFMGMFVALALFLRGRRWWRMAAVGASVITAGAALSTYSRQSYVLVIVAIVSLVVRRSLLVAALVVAAGVALVGYLPDSVTQRVVETTQQDAAAGGAAEFDNSTASRWQIWEGGMKMWAANPFGVGLNRWKDNIGSYSSYRRIDAHNFYVLTLGEGGPIGFLALLYLVYRLFRLAGFVRKHRPPDDPEAFALSLGFTVCTFNMAMGGIYGSPTLEASVMVPYWALCGLLERYVLLRQQAVPVIVEVLPPPEGPLSGRFPLAAYLPSGRPR